MIGQCVNKVCDFFDHPSKRPVPEWAVKALHYLVYSIVYVAFIMVFCLFAVLTMVGTASFVLDFLFPLRDDFLTTAWTFTWHWALIAFYALLVFFSQGADNG